MIFTKKIDKKGQVVIPKYMRQSLGLKKGTKVIFELKNKEITIKPSKNPNEFLSDFLNVPKLKKPLTLKDLKKIEDESYELY